MGRWTSPACPRPRPVEPVPMSCKTAAKYVNTSCLLSAKGLLVVLCTCCFGAGLYLVIVSSQNHREQQVQAYDDVVRNWTRSSRAQYQALQLTINNGSYTASLSLDTSEDSLHGSTKALLPYSPLKYSYNGPIFGEHAWNSTAGSYSTVLTLTVDGPSADISTCVVPVVVYKTVTLTSGNQKSCRYQARGSWNNGHCETYHRIALVCMQIERAVGGGWHMSAHPGCYVHDDWAVERFVQVPGTNQNYATGDPPAGVIEGLEQMQVTVRSWRDPYLDAMARSNDSGDFGTPSTQDLLVGLALVGAGLVLSIPLIMHVLTVYRQTHSELLSELELSEGNEGFQMNSLTKLNTRDHL